MLSRIAIRRMATATATVMAIMAITENISNSGGKRTDIFFLHVPWHMTRTGRGEARPRPADHPYCKLYQCCLACSQYPANLLSSPYRETGWPDHVWRTLTCTNLSITPQTLA